MSIDTRARWWTKLTRDLILCAVAVGLTIHESLGHGPERPSLYILYAGMMGLGPVMRYAESRQRKEDR